MQLLSTRQSLSGCVRVCVCVCVCFACVRVCVCMCVLDIKHCHIEVKVTARVQSPLTATQVSRHITQLWYKLGSLYIKHICQSDANIQHLININIKIAIGILCTILSMLATKSLSNPIGN